MGSSDVPPCSDPLRLQDSRANKTTEQQLKLLLEITNELKDRLAQEKLYLAEAQALSHTGSWAWDLTGDNPKLVHWSEEMFRIWGFDPNDGLPTIEEMSGRIVPKYLNSVQEALQKSIRDKVDTSDDFMIMLPDGTVKHLHTIRHPVLNAAGEVVKLFGASMDITERKRNEDALRRSEAYLAETQRLTHTGTFISRSIVQAHGGRLWPAAKDGPGTIFHFTLPGWVE